MVVVISCYDALQMVLLTLELNSMELLQTNLTALLIMIDNVYVEAYGNDPSDIFHPLTKSLPTSGLELRALG